MTNQHRILTIRQPWASYIIDGSKNVENRSKRISHRGQLLIHAGKQWDAEGIDPMLCFTDGLISYRPGTVPFGAIIGSVDLVDCVRDSSSEWAEPGMWHWLMENPQPFPVPIPWRGRQGLWRIGKAELEEKRKEMAG